MKLQLALDIGHSSIGWAVLTEKTQTSIPPDLLGCGVVLFEKDKVRAFYVTRAQWERAYVIYGNPAKEVPPEDMPEQIQLW